MRRSVKYGFYGAVLAGLVSATVAWANVDKTVTLRVDGQDRTVHTVASTVRGALSAAGLQVGAHDLVTPGVDTRVRNGSTIVLDRGRLLCVDVDGNTHDVWVTAPTVGAALTQLGYSAADFFSLSRDQRLPLTATDISVRTPRRVSVVHDGRTQSVTTTDATVRQLLADLGISLGPLDRMDAPAGGTLTDGERIVVARIRQLTTTAQQTIPFATTRQADGSVPAGQTLLVTPGRSGVRQVTYQLVYIDGRLTGRVALRQVVLDEPVRRVEKLGTQSTPPADRGPTEPPVAVSSGSPQAIGEAMAAARGWGGDQFSCLVQMWDRESGWRVDATNPSSGAYGIPQALPGSKMAGYGPNWQTDAATQIAWGLDYIAGRYGTPCDAWSFWQANSWY